MKTSMSDHLLTLRGLTVSFMCVDSGFVASFHHFYSIFAVETAVWPHVDILSSIGLLLITFYSV